MKNDDKTIIRLCEATSFSYRKCKKALAQAEGDYDRAYRYLSEIKQNPAEIIADSLKAFFIGEQAARFSVYDNQKVLLSFPALILLLFLFVFDIPSWLLGAIIACLMLFHMDMRIEGVRKLKTKQVKAVHVSKEERKSSNRVVYDEKTGYYEFTIE